jgi:hypothetical protein
MYVIPNVRLQQPTKLEDEWPQPPAGIIFQSPLITPKLLVALWFEKLMPQSHRAPE